MWHLITTLMAEEEDAQKKSHIRVEIHELIHTSWRGNPFEIHPFKCVHTCKVTSLSNEKKTCCSGWWFLSAMSLPLALLRIDISSSYLLPYSPLRQNIEKKQNLDRQINSQKIPQKFQSIQRFWNIQFPTLNIKAGNPWFVFWKSWEHHK